MNRHCRHYLAITSLSFLFRHHQFSNKIMSPIQLLLPM